MNAEKPQEKSSPKAYCHYLEKWRNVEAGGQYCNYKQECPRAVSNKCPFEKEK
jgi:hypothetical protein